MEFILILAVFLVFSAVSLGLFYIKRGTSGKSAKRVLGINIISIFSLLIISTFLLASGIVKAAGNDGQTTGTGTRAANNAAQVTGAGAHSTGAENQSADNASQASGGAKASGGANGLGLLAAALSTGLATIGAGIAVAISSSAALGAISEDSNLLGKTLIFVGLAEGIAIYGLIVSILILGRI